MNNRTRKIRRILVSLDGTKNSIRGLESAISIAQQSGATITGLYVIISLQDLPYDSPHSKKEEIAFAESISVKQAKKQEMKMPVLRCEPRREILLKKFLKQQIQENMI